jgi:PAS domain S-box-containing protein
MSDSEPDTFRWQTFFQHAAQPIFLVNRRRRLLFANSAWEACTGLKLADVRGRACRRRSASSSADKTDAILNACAPPPDALNGRLCELRRRAPGSTDWWTLQFQPLMGRSALLGILGTIQVHKTPAEVPFTLPERLMSVRDRQARRYRLDDLDQSSPVLKRLQDQARLAAQTRVPILLTGEAGVGKQWLARAIHQFGGQRERYFACLDAEKLPPAMLGEIIYGPRSRQHGLGTVYLREPASLPREWQSRLAETLSLGENADFPRLIVGCRIDPHTEVQAGRMLEEFYCAVSAVTIAVPRLRERSAELPRLVDMFLDRARESRRLSPDALKVLLAHDWPENLRELQDVLRDTSRRAKGERIEPADLPFAVKHGALPPERRLPLDTLLEQVERRLIALALKLANNNQTRAAELLEIWRPRLMRRMEKFDFKPQA